MHDPQISVFSNAMAATPLLLPLTISEALGNIQSGVWKDYVIYLQGLPPDRYKSEKKGSHALTFQGTFIHRSNAGILTPSGACVLDYDGIDSTSKAAALRDDLAKDLHVVSAFLSPSAKGVKVVVKVPGTTDNEEHKRNYEAVSDYFTKKYGAPKTDTSAKDLARLCFVSYDPDLRSRPYAEALTFEPPAAPVLDPQPATIRSSASSSTPATITTGNADDALDEARRHLHNLFSKASEAKQQGPGESRHQWMLSAAKIARQYVLGGIPEASMRDVLTSEYLAIFDAGEHVIRRQDAVRAFNGRKTLDLAQRDGALTPDPARTSMITAVHQRDTTAAAAGSGLSKYIIDDARFAQINTFLAFHPNWDNEPEVMPAPLTLNGVPISSEGGITLIAAAPGVGKSVVSGAIWAAANGKTDGDFDRLGFEVKPGIIAEYFDTEQSKQQHYATWKRAMRRAGYNRGELPDHVDCRFHRTPTVDPVELAAYVNRYIYEGDAHLYIIDGVTDLMLDTLDRVEAVEIVKMFEAAAAANGVTIVLTIHPNDKTNSGTARGWIGSELMRKSTTALRIDAKTVNEERFSRVYIPDIFKNRVGATTVETWFKWDDAQKMHVTTSAPQEGGSTRKYLPLTRSVLIDIYDGAASFGTNELIKKVMAATGAGASTAKALVYEAKDNGVLNDYTGNGRALSINFSDPLGQG